MLSSVLGMEELVVEDVMLPTNEIIGIDIDKGNEEANNCNNNVSKNFI